MHVISAKMIESNCCLSQGVPRLAGNSSRLLARRRLLWNLVAMQVIIEKTLLNLIACIVDEDADINYAADRITFGAFYQAGMLI